MSKGDYKLGSVPVGTEIEILGSNLVLSHTAQKRIEIRQGKNVIVIKTEHDILEFRLMLFNCADSHRAEKILERNFAKVPSPLANPLVKKVMPGVRLNLDSGIIFENKKNGEMIITQGQNKISVQDIYIAEKLDGWIFECEQTYYACYIFPFDSIDARTKRVELFNEKKNKKAYEDKSDDAVKIAKKPKLKAEPEAEPGIKPRKRGRPKKSHG